MRPMPQKSPRQDEGAHGLRVLRHVYTANDPMSRQAVFTKARPGAPTTYCEGGLAVDDIYSAPTTPPFEKQSLFDDDGTGDGAVDGTGGRALGAGAASPGGTVCRVAEFAPRYECTTHRGQNLDYAVVIEGSIVLALGSGQETRLERGDVAVQRAASHVWRNPSQTDWARMLFVLQDSSSTMEAASRNKCHF